ncbi:lysine decarboxylase [Lentibacillus persicus]|uniref:Lysine decarboxylase n=1 Tax=Lentibacillus persicus TaxID=640948 RepID=A0A1I1UP26_9BACI|nr:aminotransferase class I/II-fold pyridoxal phosphate-dependent enzyme [Lentibacillus persicus]SFD72454.1 lysine decarboxylase [Lentibacillus persicus]
MSRNQKNTPLYTMLENFTASRPVSFHVPGHKNGNIIPSQGKEAFKSLLQLDLTELSGLDDLHAPHGVIKDAQELTAELFEADASYFLIGGSTSGNLAMILSVCSPGDEMIVQRNSHKSIFNGLELAGAKPVFVAPEFDEAVHRYTAPGKDSIKRALDRHPRAKGVVLTYPDYFGRTYGLNEMIQLIHEYNIPVLVDEAHGIHFFLDDSFPEAALAMGADAVVQSAHKMAPAMTMGAFLHTQSERMSSSRIARYLQMVQSSSPSYPIMASLDLARSFLAHLTSTDLRRILNSAEEVRDILKKGDLWHIVPGDDPLKITLQAKLGVPAETIAGLFEQEGIYPELATHNQLLLVHGLAPFNQMKRLEKAVGRINAQLKNIPNHDIIDTNNLFKERITELELDYFTMNQRNSIQVPLRKAENCIAAEAVIPYPPGIPFVLKGEQITRNHIEIIEQFMQQGVTIQHRDIEEGISVFC